MPKIWRVYSGSNGHSHISEMPLATQPFVDAEGAHGEATSMQAATGITFRVSPPGYVLGWHRAPRRQYSISLSGTAEIEVGDGTVARLGPGDVVLAEDFDHEGALRVEESGLGLIAYHLYSAPRTSRTSSSRSERRERLRPGHVHPRALRSRV